MTCSPSCWQRGGLVAAALLAAFLLTTQALALPIAPCLQEESEEEAQEESQEQAEEAAREAAAREAAAREEQAGDAQEEAPPPQEPIFDPVAAQLAPGTADELVTLAGSRVIGEFKELKSAQVKFKDPATGDIYVKWELVRTVRSSRFFEVVLRDGSKFYGLIVGTDDGRLFVGVGERFTEVARTDVVEVTRIRENFWDRLKGNVDVGLSINKSSNQRDVTTNFSGNYRTRRAFSRLSGTIFVRRQEGATNVTRNDATLSYNRFLGRNWFATATASAEHNNELNLDIRTMAAVGGGYHLLRNIRNDLMVWAGLAPSREVFIDEQPSQSNLETVLGTYYTFNMLGLTNTTTELTGLWFASLTTSGRHRFNVDAALRHEFTTDLYMSLNGFWREDTKPPSDTSSGSDYGLTLGAGVKW